jgi:hypothetical protein
MLFCKIEKDDKTYKYLKDYLNFLSNPAKENNNILFLDNKIQHEELNMHLYYHEIDPCKESKEKECELESWIQNNGKPFRQYLSSIKLLALISYSKGFKKGLDLDFKSFTELCDNFNNLKELLIDHIF